jgi:hypothetical protein
MRPDDVPIRQACDQAWTSMTPTAQGRHCAACDRTVHDLSTMTAAQVRAFMRAQRRRGGRFCISYRVDASGEIVVRPPHVVPARRLVRVAAMTTALAACAPWDDAPLPPGLDSDIDADIDDELDDEPVEVVPAAPLPAQDEPPAVAQDEPPSAAEDELPPPPELEAQPPDPKPEPRRRHEDSDLRYLGFGGGG